MGQYYDWPKIMAGSTLNELTMIVNNRFSYPEDKFLAAEAELAARGIPTKGDNMIRLKIDPGFCYLAADMDKKGKSNQEILHLLINEGLNREQAELVIREFSIIKNRAKKKFKVSLTICIPLAIIMIYIYFSVIMDMGIIVSAGFGALFGGVVMVPFNLLSQFSPKKFRKHEISYYTSAS